MLTGLVARASDAMLFRGTSSCNPRSQTHKYHHRGLRQFCSVLGEELPEYKYMSKLFDTAMDEIGQILEDSKMALIATQNALANRTTVPCRHFGSISSPFYCLGGGIYEFVT